MKKIIFAGSLIAGLVVTGLSGCYNDNYEDLYTVPGATCDTANITYTNTLKAIVDNQCATVGCHNGAIPSGWDLTTYNGLKTVAINGKLMPAINHTGPNQMPKGLPRLDDCTISKFQAWVNNNEPE